MITFSAVIFAFFRMIRYPPAVIGISPAEKTCGRLAVARAASVCRFPPLDNRVVMGFKKTLQFRNGL